MLIRRYFSSVKVQRKRCSAILPKGQIIYLTKVRVLAHNPTHEVKSHFFLGLAAEADACNCLRKSRFIDASNLRVGTFRSASFFSFSVGVLTMTLPDVVELFGTDEKCRELLERLRWPADPECPRCHTQALARLDARLLYCKECDYQFTVTAGTIFHDSHLPLQKWFMATLLLCEARKGMSANQIKRTLGVSYKTAWYLCHRIRAAMKEIDRPMMDGTVEVDETYVGGKTCPRTASRDTRLQQRSRNWHPSTWRRSPFLPCS